MKSVLKLMLALALCLAIVFTIASCGNGGKDSEGSKDPVDKSSISIVDGEIFAYNKVGDRVNYDRQFVDVGGSTYYAIENRVVTGNYVISGQAYAFDATTGAKLDTVPDSVFITCEGITYYAKNGFVARGRQIIDNYIYQFDSEGKMITGDYDGYFYAPDGKLMYTGVVSFDDVMRYNVPGQITEEDFEGGIINPILALVKNIVGEYFASVTPPTVEGEGEAVEVLLPPAEAEYTFSAKEVWGDIYPVRNEWNHLNEYAVRAYFETVEDYVTTIYDVYGGDEALLETLDMLEETTEELMSVYEIVDPANSLGTEYVELIALYAEGSEFTGCVYVCILTAENDEDELEPLADKLANLIGYNAGALAAHEGACMYDGEYQQYTVTESYYLVNGLISEAPETDVLGTLYESDADRDDTNNATLSGAYGTLTMADGTVYNATTDSDGNFNFGTISNGAATLQFTLYGYIDINVEIENIATFDFTRIVMDRQVSNNLQGKVVIADADTNSGNNSALSGATVTLVRTSGTNTLEFSTTTNSSGDYYFSGLTAGAYDLVIECEGYITIEQTVYVRYNETNVYNASLEAIPAAGEGEEVATGSASGTIIDARTGNAIAGLTVYIYPGVNNVEGDYILRVYTDGSGSYSVADLMPGNYTARIVDERELADEDERYGELTKAVKILPGTSIPNQGATVSNSIGLSIDGMRVVLTWGSTPGDLDSHMTFGSNHVYYSNKTIGNVSLDVDDTSAYGPETITVSSIGSYTYKYYIYNYSNSGTMSGAGATVNVYFGTSSTPAYTFHAPSGSGYFWHVFTYNAVTGEFTVNNTVRSSAP